MLVGFGDRPGALLKNMKKNDQLFAPAVEYSIERTTVMAPQFSKFAFNLRAVREGKMRALFVEQIDTVDLPVNSELHSDFLLFNEIVYRFTTVR